MKNLYIVITGALMLALAAAATAGVVDAGTAVQGALLAQVGVADLKALESSMKRVFEAMGGRIKDVEAMMLDIAQKNAYVPYSGSGGGSSDQLRKALEGNEDIPAMRSREFRGHTRFSLPTAAAIIGPTTPGTAPLQDPDRASGIVGTAQRRVHVRSLLPTLDTDAGATQFTQLSAFTNSAEAQGHGSSPEEREGQVLPESGMTFELETVPVVTIGHWLPASSQVLNDMAALDLFIRTWLSYGLMLKEDDELLNGVGGNSHIEGLVTAAQAYNRGASNDTRADTLRKAITQLALAEHICSGIVVNPADEEALDLLKETTGQYLRVKVGGRVWDVPVIGTNAMDEGTWLAGDFQAALLRPRQGVTVEISNSHSDFFTRNLLAIRAELREALEIHRPLGFVTGSFQS